MAGLLTGWLQRGSRSGRSPVLHQRQIAGTRFLAGLVMLAATAAVAQNPAAALPPGATPPGQTASGELAALEQFLDLSDAELAQMEQIIARLRAMTPAQRSALRDEIAAFRKLPEPQRQQIRQGWGQMPAEIQAGWREMMQNATPERRAEIQARLQALAPDAKAAYRRQLVDEYLKSKSK